MSELDIPMTLTYASHTDSSKLIDALLLASEQVIWEEQMTESGSVIVSILNVIRLDEKTEKED